MNTVINDIDQTKISSWRETYHQLLYSADTRAPQLRRALICLLLAAAIQGLALACLYPVFMAALAHHATLWYWLSGMTALMMISTVLRWCGQGFDYNGDMLHTTHALRTKLGEQLRRMPLLKLQDQRAGEVNATLLGNVDENLMYSLTIIDAIFVALVTPFTAAFASLFFDWRLGLLMLLVFPTIVPFYRWRRPVFKRGMALLNKANHKTSADVVEYMQGLPVLRAARCEGAKAKTLQESFIYLQHIQTLGQKKGTKPSLIIATTMEVGLLLIAAIGMWWVAKESMHLAILAGALAMMVRFSEPLSNFISYVAIMEMIEVALGRVQQFLAVPPLPHREPLTVPQQFDLHFKNIQFRYEGQTEAALQDINLIIPQRSLTALVGPSGSGKSTLARLVLRHFDGQQGTLHIGGVDIRNIPTETLNRLVSVVFQDVYLFDDSVLANIHMARPEATRQEIEHAAALAQCDFIQRLPQSWDTRLGDIGGRLSGGERQRISIARALLKDAPIIILDEPTAALDTESECAVQRAIDTLIQEKTVIVIAHRLSTITGAKQIVVLDNGRITEVGTHAELLQNKARYSRMWAAQQRAKNWHAGVSSKPSLLMT